MKALSFGEIIWDVNGDERTLGGAPLNVAGHLARLGDDVIIVSATGNDEEGREALRAINELGVDSSFVHAVGYDTGFAKVELKDGSPSYSFNDPAAWDAIALSSDEIERLSTMDFDCVIFGTLALRHETSRNTLFTLLDALRTKEVFFDVNLRLSFYSDDLIVRCLEKATMLKMNDEELPVVARAISSGPEEVYSRLFSRFPNLKKIILTLGARGAQCHERGNVTTVRPKKTRVVSTVGAGDSLSAAFLHYDALGLDTKTSLERATRLASYVVGQMGAIPQYSEEILLAD